MSTDVTSLEQRLQQARAILWGELQAAFKETDLRITQIAKRAKLAYPVAYRALGRKTHDAVATEVIRALHSVLVKA